MSIYGKPMATKAYKSAESNENNILRLNKMMDDIEKRGIVKNSKSTPVKAKLSNVTSTKIPMAFKHMRVT